MWRPGAAVTLAVTNTAEALTADPALLVKAVRIMQNPGNSGILYVGDSTLTSGTTPKVGVIGWIDNPDASTPGDNFIELREEDAPNGILVSLLKVSGTATDICLWSY